MYQKRLNQFLKLIVPISFLISATFAIQILVMKLEMWLDETKQVNYYQDLRDSLIITFFFLIFGLIYKALDRKECKCENCECKDCDCGTNTPDIGPL